MNAVNTKEAPREVRVLLVDDDQAFRAALRRSLVTHGYEVSEAATGVEALAIMQDHVPDAVILDINMPGLGGMDVLRRIRLQEKTRHLPVILLTGDDDVGACVDGFETGADDFARKPASGSELAARIESAIRRRKISWRVESLIGVVKPGEEDRPPLAVLVEDDPTHALFLAHILRAAGFETDVETTVAGFRSLLQERTPDLIILDVQLPDGNGLDLLGEIRGRDNMRDVPIITISGYAVAETRARALMEGAEEFLEKPIPAAALQARVTARWHAAQETRALRHAVEVFAEESSRDAKTGLAHYGTLVRVLEREMERAHRHQRPLSFLIIDIDHFKQFNDTRGHAAGDDALRGLSRLLRNHVRASDLPARFGGEEFACVLPETDIAGALRLAEIIRQQVDAMPDLGFTVSIGATQMIATDAKVEDIIERADRALYRAKGAGRNRVEASPAPPTAVAEPHRPAIGGIVSAGTPTP